DTERYEIHDGFQWGLHHGPIAHCAMPHESFSQRRIGREGFHDIREAACCRYDAQETSGTPDHKNEEHHRIGDEHPFGTRYDRENTKGSPGHKEGNPSIDPSYFF